MLLVRLFGSVGDVWVTVGVDRRINAGPRHIHL